MASGTKKAPKLSATQKKEKNEAVKRRDELARNLQKERDDFQWWQRIMSDSRMSKTLQLFEKEVEQAKEKLIDVEKTDDIKRVQAGIRARRALLRTFEDAASDSGVKEAQKELKAHEDKYPLFLQERIDTDTGEVKAS